MKQSKRKALLAMVMSFALAFSMLSAVGLAQAAGQNVVTISDSRTNHTYSAYQIFKGDLSDGVLSNIQWGDNVSTTNLITDLKTEAAKTGSALEPFKNIANDATAADIAKILETNKNNAAVAKAFADFIGDKTTGTPKGTCSTPTDSKYVIDVGDNNAGYYLIKDTGGKDTAGDYNSAFILQVAGQTSATPKGSGIKSGKDEQEDHTGNWQKAADFEIGEQVPFRIWGSLPTDYTDYRTYYYQFEDTLGKGLAFDATSVEMYVVSMGDAVPNFAEMTASNKLSSTEAAALAQSVTGNDASSTTVKWTCGDLKTSAIKDKVGNNKAIVITYKATLTTNADVTATGIENEVKVTYTVDHHDDGDGDKGTTPPEKTFTFTYKLDTNKTDAAGTKLPGAEFYLLNADKTKAATLDANGKITGWVAYTAGAETPGGTKITSSASDSFVIKGLDGDGDDQIYYLHEVKAPAQYNLPQGDAAYFKIEITGGVQRNSAGTAGEIVTLNLKVNDGDAINGNLNTGTVTHSLINEKGNELPSTGGVGTVVFTIIGLAIMIAAAGVFVVRRRSSADAEE